IHLARVVISLSSPAAQTQARRTMAGVRCLIVGAPTCCMIARSSIRFSRSYLVSYSIGSSLMMEAPWLLPIQNVGGLVELSTSTLRTFVVLGSRYSIDSAVLVFNRMTRSVVIPAVQRSPFLSHVTS